MTAPTTKQVHLDGAMTNISIAYRNTSYIAEAMFPVVPVRHQSDEYFVFEAADWFRDEAGPRAPGTRGPEGEYSVSSCAYNCRPYSFSKPVPDEVVENADEPLKPRIEAVEFSTDKVLLRMERIASAAAFADSVWTGSPSSAISPTWDDDASEPLDDIAAGREDIIKRIGRRPNVLVMGQEVWRHFQNHPDLLERVKYTQLGILTPELLARIAEVDRVLIGSAVYDSGNEGATATQTYIWGKHALLLYVPPNPGLMIPSAGYIFAWKNRRALRFRREEELTDVYRAEANFDVKVTCADAGYWLTDCVS